MLRRFATIGLTILLLLSGCAETRLQTGGRFNRAAAVDSSGGRENNQAGHPAQIRNSLSPIRRRENLHLQAALLSGQKPVRSHR